MRACLNRLLAGLGEDGPAEVLLWPDGGLPELVSRAPLTWPLDGNALEDLRWYLEDYLAAPFGVWEERGPAVAGRLAGWGEAVFGSVFAPGPARDVYQRARDRGLEVVIRSAQPGLLALPWELMRDGDGPVALGAGGLSRSLPVAGGAGTLEVAGGRLRVLMVISRPAGTGDVGYQMVARPLLERLAALRGEVDLTVLRPPTFDQLTKTLNEAAASGEPFHVVHFDGHGDMPGRPAGGGVVAGGRPAMTAGPGEGVLVFERPGGGSDPVTAAKVAAAVTAGRVPVVVLNVCQSGALGKDLEATVATALLNGGCAAVVAMTYSVYAVAAAEFMASFYESLFTGASVGQAVTAGRQRLYSQDARPSPRGEMPLADWLVPVHYLRRDVSFPQARTTRPASAPTLEAALDQIRTTPAGPDAKTGPLAAAGGVFVGRDDLIYRLEAAARRQHIAVLCHQLGITAQARGHLDEAGEWYRKSLAITEALGNQPYMAATYGQLGLLAGERGQPTQALDWMIRCVALFAQFPHPATGPGPQHLARLARQLGLPAVEDAWQQVTGPPAGPARTRGSVLPGEPLPGGLLRHTEGTADTRPANAPLPQDADMLVQGGVDLGYHRLGPRQAHEQFLVGLVAPPADPGRGLGDDEGAQVHALIADVDAWARDQLGHRFLVLAAERAAHAAGLAVNGLRVPGYGHAVKVDLTATGRQGGPDDGWRRPGTAAVLPPQPRRGPCRGSAFGSAPGAGTGGGPERAVGCCPCTGCSRPARRPAPERGDA